MKYKISPKALMMLLNLSPSINFTKIEKTRWSIDKPANHQIITEMSFVKTTSLNNDSCKK